MTDRPDLDIAQLKKILHDKKAELLAVSEKSAETREPVELDQTVQGRLSRQDALQQQEMAKETERRRQVDIQRIDAALTHIDTDDYGYCLQCDEPISAKRLELDPALTTCIQCASASG